MDIFAQHPAAVLKGPCHDAAADAVAGRSREVERAHAAVAKPTRFIIDTMFFLPCKGSVKRDNGYDISIHGRM